MGTTTISVDESTRERFNDIKQELDEAESGVPDHTADSFLNALLDTWGAVDDGLYDGDNDSTTDNDVVEEMTNELRDQLDVLAFDGALTEDDVARIESSLATIEERTGKLERILEDLR